MMPRRERYNLYGKYTLELTPNKFSLTVNNTYEGAADETADEQVRFKVRVYEKTDGRKVIRVSNKSDGTKLMIQ